MQPTAAYPSSIDPSVPQPQNEQPWNLTAMIRNFMGRSQSSRHEDIEMAMPLMIPSGSEAMAAAPTIPTSVGADVDPADFDLWISSGKQTLWGPEHGSCK